jgi:hypothetical protein
MNERARTGRSEPQAKSHRREQWSALLIAIVAVAVALLMLTRTPPTDDPPVSMSFAVETPTPTADLPTARPLNPGVMPELSADVADVIVDATVEDIGPVRANSASGVPPTSEYSFGNLPTDEKRLYRVAQLRADSVYYPIDQAPTGYVVPLDAGTSADFEESCVECTGPPLPVDYVKNDLQTGQRAFVFLVHDGDSWPIHEYVRQVAEQISVDGKVYAAGYWGTAWYIVDGETIVPGQYVRSDYRHLHEMPLDLFLTRLEAFLRERQG